MYGFALCRWNTKEKPENTLSDIKQRGGVNMVKKLFQKGDVIMTTPEPGYYGVAIVLDDAKPIELSPGRLSYPMNHIMITPLLFTRPLSMADIDGKNLTPLVFSVYFDNKGDLAFWRDQVCIGIYTNRNKAEFQIIGTVDTSELYKEPLLWTPLNDRFFLCGDVASHLGREAYIQYCRDNNQKI